MSNKSKKIFLILSVIVPFLLYCLYYYGMMVKNAPYKFSEFESLRFEYGLGDSLVNKYNSKSGDYQFVNKQDSVVKRKLKLTKDDLLYLHRKAAELGFWNFPQVEENSSTRDKKSTSLHYLIEMNYKRKSKTVMFDSAYDGDASLKDANERLIREIQKILDAAEARQKN